MSLGSDIETEQDTYNTFNTEGRTESPMMENMERVLSPLAQHQQSHHNTLNANASHSQNINIQQSGHIVSEKPIYKPKFHNVLNSIGASTSTSNITRVTSVTTHQVSSLGRISASAIQPHQMDLAQHISKLIMENEQIVENAKPPISRGVKKFSSTARNLIEENSRNKSNSLVKYREEQIQKDNSKHLLTPLTVSIPTVKQNILSIQVSTPQPIQTMSIPISLSNTQSNPSQPLNLTKSVINEMSVVSSSNIDTTKKRSYSDGFSGRDVANHPQNPEKSIIKDLLLNSKNFGAISPSEADERFTCPFCKVSFRNAESLKYHTICYCQGSQANSPQSSSLSPAASPSHGYFRSNSINDKYSPNSLAKLASTSLRRYPYKEHPVNQPSTLVQLAKPHVRLNLSKVDNITIAPINSSCTGDSFPKPSEKVQAPLPSPGPFLGKTRLVDSFNFDKPLDSNTPRLPMTINENQQLVSSDSMSQTIMEHKFTLPEEVSPVRRTQCLSSNRQMVGGELLHIEDKRCKHFVGCGGLTGGSVTSLSPTSQSESEPSPIPLTPGFFSGGSVIQLSQSKEHQPKTPKLLASMTSMTSSLTPSLTPTILPGITSPITHFPYPPINSITDYNPLTLFSMQNENFGQAQTIFHDGKRIPFVPGIPGPNTTSLQPKIDRAIVVSSNRYKRNASPIHVANNIINLPNYLQTGNVISRRASPTQMRHIQIAKPIDGGNESKVRNEQNGVVNYATQWSPSKYTDAKKLTRKMESPRKRERSPEITDGRHFNYENIPSKSVVSNQHGIKPLIPLHIDTTMATSKVGRSSPIVTSISPTVVENESQQQKSKFLRPTSLPLKPGTFIQKKHHGITPTQNTMPLISPETPRPSKNVIQLYQNGNAYTYLGLKVSTKMTFCTLSRCQPFFLLNRNKLLSMYSAWIVHEDFDPHPLGLSPPQQFALYDSRSYPTREYSVSKKTITYAMVNSQSTIMTPSTTCTDLKTGQYSHHQLQQIKLQSSHILETNPPIASPSVIATVPGGYESNEDYTYIRGRGRGRYVCLECGIRCKKPSMLKKHIRTHTDVRPYTCSMCSFR